MRAAALALLLWSLLLQLFLGPYDHRLAVVFVIGLLVGLVLDGAARDLTEEPTQPPKDE